MPETPATVMVTTLSPLVDADTRHCTVVPLDHADVAQEISPSVPVGVKSVEPNASPLSVAVSAPLYGMLELPMRPQLATGAARGKERALALPISAMQTAPAVSSPSEQIANIESH